jgi:hypothetical protein
MAWGIFKKIGEGLKKAATSVWNGAKKAVSFVGQKIAPVVGKVAGNLAPMLPGQGKAIASGIAAGAGALEALTDKNASQYQHQLTYSRTPRQPPARQAIPFDSSDDEFHGGTRVEEYDDEGY